MHTIQQFRVVLIEGRHADGLKIVLVELTETRVAPGYVRLE